LKKRLKSVLGYLSEVPGANGQCEMLEETKDNLRQAVELIFEDRKEDMLRGLPEDTVMVG
jgi:predicted RNase H-like HicB family nuclease